jgi:hypothetical protein
MRLNGWQRIGVVVSLAWAIGAGLYQRNSDITKANDTASLSHRICLEAESARNDPNRDPAACDGKYLEAYKLWMDGSWANVAFVAVAPIPLGWLGVYALIRIRRWILDGFRVP